MSTLTCFLLLLQSDETVRVWGITFAKITPEVQKKYEMRQDDTGIYIASAGTKWQKLGISKLEAGTRIFAIYNEKTKTSHSVIFPLHAPAAILDSLNPSEKDKSVHTCKIALVKPYGDDHRARYYEETLQVSEELLKELRHLFRPVTISGVTFTMASTELRNTHIMNINEFVVVTAVGDGAARIGLGSLKVGHSVTSISVPGLAQGFSSPVEMAELLLKHQKENISLSVWSRKEGQKPWDVPEVLSLDLKLAAKDIEELEAALK